AIEAGRREALEQEAVATRLARDKTRLAEDKTRLAEDMTRLARKEGEARRDAVSQTLLAGERLEHARRSLYGSQLALAASKWAHDPGVALQALEDPVRCPEALREFTWRFYHRLCRRDRLRLPAHAGRVSFVAFTPPDPRAPPGPGTSRGRPCFAP